MSNLVITGLSKLERDGWGRPIPFGADATNIYLTSSLKIAGRNCFTAQDAINGSLNDKILTISPKYNFYPFCL